MGGVGNIGIGGMGMNRNKLLEMLLQKFGQQPTVSQDTIYSEPKGPRNIAMPFMNTVKVGFSGGFDNPDDLDPNGYWKRRLGEQYQPLVNTGRTTYNVNRGNYGPRPLGGQNQGFGLTGPDAQLMRLLQQRLAGGY